MSTPNPQSVSTTVEIRPRVPSVGAPGGIFLFYPWWTIVGVTTPHTPFGAGRLSPSPLIFWPLVLREAPHGSVASQVQCIYLLSRFLHAISECVSLFCEDRVSI